MTAAAKRLLRQKLKAEVFALLGGVCKHCGHADQRVLQIDPIEAIGNYARRQGQEHGDSLYYKIRRAAGIGNWQLLCANCNWLKRVLKVEHPKPGDSNGKVAHKMQNSPGL